MHHASKPVALAGVFALSLLAPLTAQSQNLFYQQANLVSDIPGLAATLDPNLNNPWGISESGGGPFWVSDNGTGVSTLYNTQGQIVPLVVQIPTATTLNNGPATGQVNNGDTTSFGGAHFIFATEDGTISAWSSGTQALPKVNNSATAVYKGLAINPIAGAGILYAANFKAGTIDVFDGNFASKTLTGNFTDPSAPAGYAPFNIQNLGGKLYVTFAKQDNPGNGFSDVAGIGHGFVDVFNLDGTFNKRLATGSDAGGLVTALNSPWGVALAPANFGLFSNDLLVGNFGDGKITAFDPTTNAELGQLQSSPGNTLAIDGLWGLQVGNGKSGGDANKVYFTAGLDGETHGLFGNLVAVPEPGAVSALLAGLISGGGLLLRKRKK